MKFIMTLFLFLLFIFSKLCVTNACHDEEREALLSFKSHLKDPSNRLSSWKGHNCCSWYGIRCSDSLHVTAVDLRNPTPDDLILDMNSEPVFSSDNLSTAITGVIPSSLFSLTRIRYLDLSFNNFMFSKIPTGLSNLTGLTYLNLSNAMFNGSVTTQFSNLTSLTQLDLSCSFRISDLSTVSSTLSSTLTIHSGAQYTYTNRGNLSASNLNWLQQLNNLRKLKLSGVDLSKASGSTLWAKPISHLSKLRLLDLSNCGISGKQVPVEQLLNLTHLSHLLMDFNFISSLIPSKLANLTSLSVLDLTRSNLQGHIPYLPQLNELHVGNNSDLMVDLHSMFAAPWPRLESIDISSTQVIGSIPPSIANTTSLVEFIAYNSLIHGQIPASMMNLSRLETLLLDMNNLSGQISPSVSNLKRLQYLSLMQNSFHGSIPDTICSITSLSYLSLALNSFTGNLPGCIGQLHLTYLIVSMNKMNGTIPSLPLLFRNSTPYMVALGSSGLTVTVDQLSFPPQFQPQILSLDSCNLGGKIPDFISNLTQLAFLSLSNNSLSGPIPSWLFNLPNLSYLDMSFNKLQGVIPPNIKLNSFYMPTTLILRNNQLQGPIPERLENIEILDLSANNFTGYIPRDVGLGNIRYLALLSNNLFGHIPFSLCQANSKLMLLDLSDNNLGGTIPTTLGNCSFLLYLNLGGNNLGGGFPRELQDARKLSFLDISGNRFDGPFPSAIQKLQELMVLNMGNNKFQGKIPQFLGDLKELRILVLQFNLFNGSIPQEINALQKLQFIGFSNNRLSGPIPKNLSGLKTIIHRPMDAYVLGFIISQLYVGVEVNLVAKGLPQQLVVVRTYNNGMDLSCNNLSGNLPPEFGLLQGLYALNLSHNTLSGNVPASVGNMSHLESLDLSYNNLSGEIPTALTVLDALSTLSLSYNNLSGKIPTGPHFDTLSKDGLAYIGNKFLCGAPDGVDCDTDSGVSPTTEVTDAGDKGGERVLLYAIVIAGYVVGFWGLFGVLYLVNEKWRKSYWAVVDQIVVKIIRFRFRCRCRRRVGAIFACHA